MPRRLLVFLFPVIASCNFVGAVEELIEGGAEPDWALVWSDEFEGASIDSTKWTHWVTGNPYSGEAQYYTDRPVNSRIEDGRLVIEARREAFTGPDGTRSYTSARLNTRHKADWRYIRVDVRARLPRGKGLWPAAWMLPTSDTYGAWAASGEIDIMELTGSLPNVVFGSIHYGGPKPHNRFSSQPKILRSGTFADAFHIFSIVWDRDRIQWFLDDEPFAEQTRWFTDGYEYPAPFDRRFYLLLNVAGRWTPGRVPG